MKRKWIYIAGGIGWLLMSASLPAQEELLPPLEEIDPAGEIETVPVEESEPAEEGVAQPEEEAAPLVEGETPPPVSTASNLTLDAVIVVDYTFKNSPDKFKIKYALNLGGRIRASSTSLTGDAVVVTDVSGYLAKWPTGECQLNISIGRVPYEIRITPINDNERGLELEFKQMIAENWQSECRFTDAPEVKFITTTGSPEMWMAKALEETTPALDNLRAPISPEGTTTTRFTIDKQSIADEGLGTAAIEGTGVITIEPILPKPATPTP